MKGNVRIGGAIFLGIFVILGAFYVQSGADTVANGSVIVATAPERTAIATTDSNQNGIEDWEESLQNKVFETIDTPTSTVLEESDEPYEPPTTLTGKFSEAFFQDYLEGKINGADFSDPTALVGNAVKAIEQNTKSRRHTRLELLIVPTTNESVREYGNQVSEIMKKHSIQNENKSVILQRALTADDPKMLEPLDAIQAVYANTIADALFIAVPDSLTDEHLDFLNAVEAIKTDTEAMRVAFTDPLYTLARVRVAEQNSSFLGKTFQAIARTLREFGATYENTEPGVFFYLFNT